MLNLQPSQVAVAGKSRVCSPPVADGPQKHTPHCSTVQRTAAHRHTHHTDTHRHTSPTQQQQQTPETGPDVAGCGAVSAAPCCRVRSAECGAGASLPPFTVFSVNGSAEIRTQRRRTGAENKGGGECRELESLHKAHFDVVWASLWGADAGFRVAGLPAVSTTTTATHKHRTFTGNSRNPPVNTRCTRQRKRSAETKGCAQAGGSPGGRRPRQLRTCGG